MLQIIYIVLYIHICPVFVYGLAEADAKIKTFDGKGEIIQKGFNWKKTEKA